MEVERKMERLVETEREDKSARVGQIWIAFEACALMKVERKEERKREDKSTQVWIGIAYI